MWHSWGALLFSKVISQIMSMSHRTKIATFDPNWAFLDCNSSLKSTDGFEIMQKAWCSIEEVSYYLLMSSIKFHSHAGWKIDNLDQIWVRSLDRSQLSNPSDLPCSHHGQHLYIRRSYDRCIFIYSKFHMELIHQLWVTPGQSGQK